MLKTALIIATAVPNLSLNQSAIGANIFLIPLKIVLKKVETTAHTAFIRSHALLKISTIKSSVVLVMQKHDFVKTLYEFFVPYDFLLF